MSASKAEILKLYKNLMLYSKSLRFTDVTYYKKRISSEFKQNKSLSKPEDIQYALKKGEALLQRGSIV
ncbi:MIEF1 upstream open reading frame protein [Vanessa cardui]|uniref:MIEF1 upstream open reading frame protein n=1 Tax=Vanessa cardui TaxID=171605 RepID=UPI001F130A10|nr:MIEF1 upstream open reading frame protein [Vanessa cardui]